MSLHTTTKFHPNDPKEKEEGEHPFHSQSQFCAFQVTIESTWGFEISLCSVLVLSIPDLPQPFEIETSASDYVVGTVLTQHGNLVAYHSETLSNVVYKYPTYDKEMYYVIQSFQQWKHYILKKEIVIHTDHKPLQFMQI